LGTGSYGYNNTGAPVAGSGLDGHWSGSGGNQVLTCTRENDVAHPSDMIAMGDATIEPYPALDPLAGNPRLPIPVFFAEFYNAAVRALPSGNLAVQAMKKRHGGRWNIVFCDAHVENFKPSKLFNLTDPVLARRWNYDHEPHNEGWNPPPPP
jgi:prepilin-type processing-associated H-X9-DG protein